MAGTVLIFDDDTDLLEVCSIILKARNFNVIGRSRCNEIIADMEKYQPNVVLMDNWIPDIGGVKAIQLIKNSEPWKQVPVIFFSANNDIAELATEAGADYFLRKPFELAELEEIVSTAIRQSTPR